MMDSKLLLKFAVYFLYVNICVMDIFTTVEVSSNHIPIDERFNLSLPKCSMKTSYKKHNHISKVLSYILNVHREADYSHYKPFEFMLMYKIYAPMANLTNGKITCSVDLTDFLQEMPKPHSNESSMGVVIAAIAPLKKIVFLPYKGVVPIDLPNIDVLSLQGNSEIELSYLKSWLDIIEPRSILFFFECEDNNHNTRSGFKTNPIHAGISDFRYTNDEFIITVRSDPGLCPSNSKETLTNKGKDIRMHFTGIESLLVQYRRKCILTRPMSEITDYHWPSLKEISLVNTMVTRSHWVKIADNMPNIGNMVINNVTFEGGSPNWQLYDKNTFTFLFIGNVRTDVITKCRIPRNVQKLVITFNNVHKIAPGAFEDMVLLEELRLNNNLLSSIGRHTFKGLQYLSYLSLANNRLKGINRSGFKQLINLRYLDLRENYLREIDIKSIFEIRHLVFLEVSNNKLSEGNIYRTSSPRIGGPEVKVYGRRNGFIKIPLWFCQLSHAENHVDLSENNITFDAVIGQIKDMQSVVSEAHGGFRKVTLNLSRNAISSLNFSLPANQLHTLFSVIKMIKMDLSDNPIVCDCHSYVLYNYLSSVTKDIHASAFSTWKCAEPKNLLGIPILKIPKHDFLCPVTIEDCPNSCLCYKLGFNQLIYVDCSFLNMSSAPQSLPSHVFRLNLRGNVIASLSGIFDYSNYPYLEEIDVSNNKIKAFPGTFPPHNLWNLTVFYLHSNELSSLPDYFDEFKIKEITLGGNFFQCDCHAKRLVQWLKDNKKTVKDITNVKCSTGEVKGKLMINVRKLELICELSSAEKEAISVGIITFIISVAIISVVKFRTEAKVILYSRFNWHPFDRRDEDNDIEDKLYDAFVSYSSYDYDWVLENLLPKLETREHPYRLCLADKDFLPSESIIENICRCVRYSRRMIVILTKNYVQSEWCKMEFAEAHHRVINDRKMYLVILRFNGVNNDELNDAMRSYVKTNTYIEVKSAWLWERLLYSMPMSSLATLRGQELPEEGFGVLFPEADSFSALRVENARGLDNPLNFDRGETEV